MGRPPTAPTASALPTRHVHPPARQEWAYILNDSTPALLAVADTGVLDKLVEHMPDDASGWPSCGILLLGDEPANELPPGVAVTHGLIS